MRFCSSTAIRGPVSVTQTAKLPLPVAADAHFTSVGELDGVADKAEQD